MLDKLMHKNDTYNNLCQFRVLRPFSCGLITVLLMGQQDVWQRWLLWSWDTGEGVVGLSTAASFPINHKVFPESF
jgi:hypothetical protein